MPIDNDHLAVEAAKRAQAEVAMALELAEGNDPLRDALDQRAPTWTLGTGWHAEPPDGPRERT